MDDSVESLNTFPVSREIVETPTPNAGSRASSLLFSGNGQVLSQASSDSTPMASKPSLQLGAQPTTAPIATAQISTSEEESDWDKITTPVSPNTGLSSSVERLPQSCPESPLYRRPELPRERKSFTKKLLKPLLGPIGRSNITTEDVLTLGVNQLFRSSTRDSDDGLSSGAATPAGYSTPSRSRSKERAGSISDSECGFGAPLARSTSDNTSQKTAKRKKSFLGFSNSNGSSSDGALWRTQSASDDMRRVKSRESEDVKRPRSGSTNQAYGPKRQLRMLNGRIYGAKRSNNQGKNLFASARYVIYISFFV
jgi:hypothetical protein